MNDGVAMLIERMKTHPEEFVAEPQYGATKWQNLLSEYRPFLDKEDVEAFDAAHKATVFEYMRQRFTQQVMQELIDPIEESNTRKRGSRFTQHLVNLGQTPIAGVTQTV